MSSVSPELRSICPSRAYRNNLLQSPYCQACRFSFICRIASQRSAGIIKGWEFWGEFCLPHWVYVLKLTSTFPGFLAFKTDPVRPCIAQSAKFAKPEADVLILWFAFRWFNILNDQLMQRVLNAAGRIMDFFCKVAESLREWLVFISSPWSSLSLSFFLPLPLCLILPILILLFFFPTGSFLLIMFPHLISYYFSCFSWYIWHSSHTHFMWFSQVVFWRHRHIW